MLLAITVCANENKKEPGPIVEGRGIMKTILILISATILISCNHDSGSKKDSPVDGQACPLNAPMDRQEYLIGFKDASLIPSKLQVFYNDVEKYNDCTELRPDSAPVVDIESSHNILTITVLHFKAFPTLPTTADLRVNDLGDCTSQPRRIFAPGPIPLSFKTKTIGDPACKTSESVSQIGAIVE